MKILIIEDEPTLLATVKHFLENEKYIVETANNYRLALERIGTYDYDCILLDIMLPDGSGLEVLKLIRSTHKELPIMMISALQSEMDKVIALDLGADDYMTKPFGVLEMTSRIQARLRKADHHILISLGNVTIDDQKHICVMNNKEVYLTNKEYSILKLLIKHKGNVLSKESIFQQVWETNFMGETRTLDMHIKSLRQKLMSYHANVSISTIRGIGYQIS